MKTPEDEAFEDIERRQGGGFKAKQAMAADKVGPFERWWYYEGSGPPQKGEDCEEHTKRMCKIAWSNGADVTAQPAQERDFSCKVCGNKPNSDGELEHGKGCYTQDENGGGSEFILDAVTALQPAQEPVAWVGLTLDEIEELFQSAAGADEETDIRFARLIEAKLKEKNT